VISDINNFVNDDSEYDSNDSGYNSYNEYEDLIRDINEATQNSKRKDSF
ncbi:34289_t:CDS:1, partial [Racocetra persica]